jgi:hypothetical protein
LKKSNNKIEEVLGELVDHTFRVEHWSNIAKKKKNVMNKLMSVADLLGQKRQAVKQVKPGDFLQKEGKLISLKFPNSHFIPVICNTQSPPA